MWGEELLIASHDNPAVGRNAPPAGQDEPASPEFIEGHVPTDESLIGTQDRLNRKAAKQAIQNALQIEGTQGELFPEEAAKGLDEQINEEYQRINNPKVPTGKEKAIEDWRREQGLEGTNVLPPWANASIMDENTIDPKKLKGDIRQKKIRDLYNNPGTEAEGKAARDKLKYPTDLPNFLQSRDTDYKDWDTELDNIRDPNTGLMDPDGHAVPGREKELKNALLDAARRHGRLYTPQGQLELISEAAMVGGSFLLLFLQAATGLNLNRI